MKDIKIAEKIAGVWLLFFITYNIYFGWNAEPINNAEKICEGISDLTFLVVMVYYFLIPLNAVYKKWIEKQGV